jgi:hypothetical protein
MTAGPGASEPVDAGPDAPFLGDATDTRLHGPAARVTDPIRRLKSTYAGDDHRPIGSYAVLEVAYLTACAALAGVVRRRGRLPERFHAGDLFLLAVATHRLSRTVSKDVVTSPLRAPFTRFKGAGAPGELSEEVRGKGMHRAVGELITCPFCLAQWVATAFAFGLVLAPRPTRFVASIFTTVATADLLQFVYAGAEKASSK